MDGLSSGRAGWRREQAHGEKVPHLSRDKHFSVIRQQGLTEFLVFKALHAFLNKRLSSLSPSDAVHRASAKILLKNNMHTQYILTLFQCYREHLEHNCTTWKLTCYEKNTQKSFHNKSVNTFMLPIAMINPIKQPEFVLQTVTKGVNAVSVVANIPDFSKKSQFLAA